jgi:hypothetical protein
MPQAADIVIDNGAATPVAKTFTLLTPAAGDGSSARWALKEGTISVVFPKIEVSARKNAGANARKALVSITVPSSYTEAATGLTAVGSSAVFNGSATIPDDFPEALKNDFVAFVVNGVANAIVKACLRDGLPAT